MGFLSFALTQNAPLTFFFGFLFLSHTLYAPNHQIAPSTQQDQIFPNTNSFYPNEQQALQDPCTTFATKKYTADEQVAAEPQVELTDSQRNFQNQFTPKNMTVLMKGILDQREAGRKPLTPKTCQNYLSAARNRVYKRIIFLEDDIPLDATLLYPEKNVRTLFGFIRDHFGLTKEHTVLNLRQKLIAYANPQDAAARQVAEELQVELTDSQRNFQNQVIPKNMTELMKDILDQREADRKPLTRKTRQNYLSAAPNRVYKLIRTLEDDIPLDETLLGPEKIVRTVFGLIRNHFGLTKEHTVLNLRQKLIAYANPQAPADEQGGNFAEVLDIIPSDEILKDACQALINSGKDTEGIFQSFVDQCMQNQYMQTQYMQTQHADSMHADSMHADSMHAEYTGR